MITDDRPPIGTATYSITDNLLRLQLHVRADEDLLEQLAAAGFTSTADDAQLMAPADPEREFLLAELCGGIDDADTGLRGMWTPVA
jgi:hypothetical protein